MSEKKNGKGKMSVSRRSVLKGSAAAAGAAIGSGALTGFPTIWAQNIKNVTLRSVGSGVTHIPPYKAMAEEDLGFKLEFTVLDFIAIRTRGITQPRSFDMFEPTYNDFKKIWPTGNFQAVDSTRLKHWDEAIDLYKGPGKIWPDARYGEGQNPSTVQYTSAKDGKDLVKAGTSKWLTSVPSQHNADTLGYRPDLVGRKLDTWAELINPEWRNKVALQIFPEIAMMDLAMALEGAGKMTYVDKGNMTKAEIDKTFDFLFALKEQNHFRAFWTGFMESVNLMVSGEVVLQSMWSPAVTVARSMGVPAVYADLKEGYRSWTIGYMIPKHLSGIELDATYAFFDWLYEGRAGSLFARQGYYMPTPNRTKDFLSADEYGFWYEGKAASGDILDPGGNVLDRAGAVRDGGSYKNRMGNVAVWNSEFDEQTYLVDKWNKFQAG
jgi:putative spermidine/putrescine transport system substrate-binding protein